MGPNSFAFGMWVDGHSGRPLWKQIELPLPGLFGAAARRVFPFPALLVALLADWVFERKMALVKTYHRQPELTGSQRQASAQP